MKDTLTRFGLVTALAAVGAFGLAGCGSSDGAEGGGSSEESAEFVADLQAGVDIVNEQIEAVDDPMDQIMLASDVEDPTQKYGMWVMPYYPSDATAEYISTVQIENGTDFQVTATSAETGAEWNMDQDGEMTAADAE
ncbi:hypothetical protein [Microbacterium karelineae]|uniref:hypothetical protein n=1 Tax=Microbacterium karelineae TaxID=2654283 RepID=UPI0012EA6252|nr:hypothetical protein [Microbacterium karelineae]